MRLTRRLGYQPYQRVLARNVLQTMPRIRRKDAVATFWWSMGAVTFLACLWGFFA